jgi:hypothetical protein
MEVEKPVQLKNRVALPATKQNDSTSDLPEQSEDTTPNNQQAQGYAKERFTVPVDDFFVCRCCDKVVRNPKECKGCQNLMCKECTDQIKNCPHGCQELQICEASKYAAMVYGKLTLFCVFSCNGCFYQGSVYEVVAHEQVCDYVIIPCSSPLCSKQYMKRDAFNFNQTDLVCSELCQVIVDFRKVLETKDKVEVLKVFSNHLTQAKEIVERQVKEELRPKIKEYEKMKKEIESFRQKRDEVYYELENRKLRYHPGKWNINSRIWTCCQADEKYSVGCRDL